MQLFMDILHIIKTVWDINIIMQLTGPDTAQKLLKTVVFNIAEHIIKFYYTTTKGQVINKYFNDVLINTYVGTPGQDPWEDEKHWVK